MSINHKKNLFQQRHILMDYLCIFILRLNEKENLKKSHIALINTVPHVIKNNNFDQHVINIILNLT